MKTIKDSLKEEIIKAANDCCKSIDSINNDSPNAIRVDLQSGDFRIVIDAKVNKRCHYR